MKVLAKQLFSFKTVHEGGRARWLPKKTLHHQRTMSDIYILVYYISSQALNRSFNPACDREQSTVQYFNLIEVIFSHCTQSFQQKLIPHSMLFKSKYIFLALYLLDFYKP